MQLIFIEFIKTDLTKEKKTIFKDIILDALKKHTKLGNCNVDSKYASVNVRYNVKGYSEG